jgi:O-antigen ligase
MAIGTIISLVLFFEKRNYSMFKYDKVVYFISLIIFFFTLFHSQSRSSWGMFGIFSIGYMFIYIKNNGVDKKLFYTISSLVTVSIVFFLMDNNLSNRLTLLLEGNTSGRTSEIWPFTIDQIINSPVFGYGINTYKLLALGTPAANHTSVHNLSLELLLYTGIIGFLIFSYLIWLTLKESYTESTRYYFIFLLSFIILMQFDGSLFDGKVHTNIFILILFFIYSFKLDKTTPKLV